MTKTQTTLAESILSASPGVTLEEMIERRDMYASVLEESAVKLMDEVIRLKKLEVEL